MDLIIINDSAIPLYEQITTQIKNAILAENIKAGDSLPSIRLLAKELKVSIITVKRAYEDLERDHFIETVQGKGTYVSGTNTERLKEARISELEEKLEDVVRSGKILGLSIEDLKTRLELIYEEV
ncbi:MAG: GntR family transcriptional regulator [Cellulosilyticaceae bacterium]